MPINSGRDNENNKQKRNAKKQTKTDENKVGEVVAKAIKKG